MEIQKPGIATSKPNNCVATIHHWQAIGQQFHVYNYTVMSMLCTKMYQRQCKSKSQRNTNHLLGLVALLDYGQVQQGE